MKKISELNQSLAQHFSWNKARLDCFVRLLLALFVVRTVNLSELAVSFVSRASISSRYKRLQRFFRGFELDYDWLTRFIFALFFKPTDKLYLTIDRTNWFFGRAKINILTLAIAYEGVAIPLCWQLLDKAGNASAFEHQALIERFVALFGKDCIAGVLGDREFASGELFHYFNQTSIPFYIRIKEGAIVRVKNKALWACERLFAHLNPKEQAICALKKVEIFDQAVNLAGARSETGELMIVATNQIANNAIFIYLRRWEIECLFGCLKRRGFRFEDTHLTHLARLSTLLALLTIGFCWAHKVGEWQHQQKPIKLKNYRQIKRPQHSFFRLGFDFIRHLILSPFSNHVTFKATLHAFIPKQFTLTETVL